MSFSKIMVDTPPPPHPKFVKDSTNDNMRHRWFRPEYDSEPGAYPDSNHLLGQRWHFVGSFVGPTSTNDVSSMSTSPAYANVMPTILSQVSRWANVGPT